jgi:hypothetical protein
MIQISKDKLTIEMSSKHPVYDYVYLRYALQHVMKVVTKLSHHEDILEVFQLHQIHKLLIEMDFEEEQLEAMLINAANPADRKDKIIKDQADLIDTLQKQLKIKIESIEA